MYVCIYTEASCPLKVRGHVPPQIFEGILMQLPKNSRFIFSIFNTIATGVIRTFSVSYHQLLNSNMRSLVGAEPETGSVPNGTLNPCGLPLSPHFHDVMPLWLSGRSLMRACTSAGSQKCGSGRIMAVKGLMSTLLNAKMRNGTPYGLVDLTDTCTLWPL